MAGSLNKVTLIGNLGREPEIRSMQTGGRVATLSIATSESWKDKNSGERKEKTEWHKVVIFNEALVGIVERYLRKGSKVYLEGQLETRKWQDQATGQDKYTTEVVLRPFRGELVMLDAANSNRDSGGGYVAAGAAAGGSLPGPDSFNQMPGGMADFDDEIPF